MDLEEARKTFFVEAEDLLKEMEQGLLELEGHSDPQETINRLFRAAHTIKGSSGLFGFDAVGAFTHRVESVLDGLRDGHLKVGTGLVELLLRSCDHMSELVAAAADSGTPGDEVRSRDAALVAELEAIENRERPSAEGTASGGQGHEITRWRIEWDIGPDMARHGLDPIALLRYLRQQGVIESPSIYGRMPPLEQMEPERCYLSVRFDYLTALPQAEIRKAFEFFLDQSELHIAPAVTPSGGSTSVATPPPATGSMPPNGESCETIGERVGEVQPDKPSKGRSSSGAVIRVDASKLDRLINLVGELVIAGATTNVLAASLGDERLLETNSVVTRLVEDIRDSALNLRMVQIADTFARFQRVVRDLSRDLGKEIELAISGGDTELDKTVVEKIGDPLTHLVRNAIDHGIELPDQREAAGKPRKGTLSLNAFHDSGSIVIQVSDDGRGFDMDRLLSKAREAGIVDINQSLGRQEIQRLAFEPGISTAGRVTNLSGRGVGLDVVKRNIEALRGTVEAESEPEAGTRVSIRLPLTLAIIDGFRVGVAENSYVIPLDTVIECIEIEAGKKSSSHARYINLRGEVLPFLRLRELFGEAEPGEGVRENIVVVSNAGKKAGLVVDELLGEYQTVIKPLGRLFRNVHGLSGATILGSGDVAIILDIPQLIQKATAAAAGGQKLAVGM